MDASELKIEISNLNYTYPGREKTLDNINIRNNNNK